MTQYITHFTKHTDEAAAKAALPGYWSTTATGWDWSRSGLYCSQPSYSPAALIHTPSKAGSNVMVGYIQRVSMFPTRVSDAQLQALTT